MERSVYQRLEEIEGEHWWFRARRSILKSVIARYAPSPSNTLLERKVAGNLSAGSRAG